MMVRSIEKDNMRYFRIEFSKPVRVILGSKISREEKISRIRRIIDDLKKFGWVCGYDKDLELLLCEPRW